MRYPRTSNKEYHFGQYRPIIKGTLLGEQSSSSSVFRLQLDGFCSTFHPQFPRMRYKPSTVICHRSVTKGTLAVPWLRRLGAGLSPRRPSFDPGSVHVVFVVDKVALGQVFPRVLQFSPVNFIPLVLHYTEKWKKLIVFIIGLNNKPQGCRASVASAAVPFTTKKSALSLENTEPSPLYLSFQSRVYLETSHRGLSGLY